MAFHCGSGSENMKLLLQLKSLTNENRERPAIILSSQNKILHTLTYSEVAHYTDKIRKFMQKSIKTNHICVGLLMEKNIFIPSVILSFQELNFSFVFMTLQTLTKTVQNLNIKWLLSYEHESLVISHFNLEDTLEVSIKNELKLWKSSSFSKNGHNLCFKDVFCVMQTSGSTGENKLVRVPHSCIENNVLSLNKHFGLSNTDVIYWGTPLTFDPTLVEFLLGVFSLAPLLIVPKLVSLNPKFLYDALFKIGHATFLQMVPSVFARWNKEQIGYILRNSNLKTLAFGGETFPQEILAYEHNKELKIFNLYGVTELSCWASIEKVTSEASYKNEVLLGNALDDTFIEIRDDDDHLTNEIGEICIGSNIRYCLLNYIEGKVSFPFVVRTGDLGKLNKHGLIYKGRKTRIIKRFGHKVNLYKLEEIIYREITLLSRLVYSIKHKKLLAFILIETHYDKNTKIRLLDKLRAKLLKIVPETEFPDFIDVVEHFPLNEHGKICEKTLEQYYETSLNYSAIKEHKSRDVFINILDRYLKTEFRNNVETLGKYTFFELGGSSILAMQLLSEFEEYTESNIPGEFVTLILNESLLSCINYVVDSIPFKRKLLEIDESEEPEKKRLVASNQHSLVVWRYDFKGCVDSSPLVFENSGEIYIAAGSFAHIFAILKENGEEYLKLTLPQEVEVKPCTSKCGGFVFIGCSNGSMYCIDLLQKKIIWEYNTDEKISCAPCLCRESKAIVFGSYNCFVSCVTTEVGTLLWKIKLSGSVRGEPLYCESLKTIYIGTTKGMCYALNEENGAVIWTNKVDGPIFGSHCLVNQCIIWPCVTGVLYGILLTGELKWTQKINGNIFSSLTVYENKIYFGCHDCKLYELTINEDNIKISNTYQLESQISSSPCIYKFDNKLLIVCVCNTGRLYAIDLYSAEKLLEHQLPAQSFSSPSVLKDMVFVGCRDNNLYCIDIKKLVI